MATITLRKQGKSISYQVKVRLKDLPARSATFARKSDAARWASATETHLREARHFRGADASEHTLSDMVARYQLEILPHKPKNTKNQRTQLQWWNTHLGRHKLTAITPGDIAKCRDRLLAVPTARGKRRSPSTAVRYLATLSHAFSIAIREWGWIDDNPVRKVTKPKEPRGRVRFLDDSERARLLRACRASNCPLLYPIVVLAISTGMRRGELLHLRWNQVDFTRNTVTLHDTKNGERRAVPLVGLALDLLQKHHQVRRVDVDLIFPRGFAGRWEDARAVPQRSI